MGQATVDDDLVLMVIEQVRMGRVTLGDAGRGQLDSRPPGQGDEVRVETPFLQMVMTRLWDEVRGPGAQRLGEAVKLGVDLLGRLGGAERIVHSHVDKVMQSELDSEGRDVAARLFRFLVTPTGTKIAYSAGDLAFFAEQSPDRVEAVLHRLCSPGVRILRPVTAMPGPKEATRFEVFHDVLASAVLDWSRRRFATLEVERQLLEQRRQAEEAAERERLLQARLDQKVEEWKRSEARRHRARRFALFGLTMALVVTGALAAYSLFQRNIAREQVGIAREQEAIARKQEAIAGEQAKIAQVQSNRAMSSRLATSSLVNLDKQIDLSLLLALEACRFHDDLESRNSLLSALGASPHLNRFLSGHEEVVYRVAVSPDGKTIASGSGDKTIRLWDTATGQQVGPPLTGHKGRILSLAFSPDGKALASGSQDRTVILWNLAERRRLGDPLAGFLGAVWDVAFSPDGKVLASGDGYDPGSSSAGIGKRQFGIRLWDVETRRLIGAPLIPTNSEGPDKGPAPGVITLAFKPRTRTLASAGNDGRVTFWDIDASKPLGLPLEVPPHGDRPKALDINAIAFSPDGQTLVGGIRTLVDGFQGGAVVRWNLDTREGKYLSRSLQQRAVDCVAFSPDGQILAWGGSDQTITLWDVKANRLIGATLAGHQISVESLAFSPDGQGLVSGGGDRKVIEWNLSGLPSFGQFLTRNSVVTDLAVSPDGKFLASVSQSDAVTLWDLVTRRPSGTFRSTGVKGAVISVAVSPDSKTLAFGTTGGQIFLWSVTTRRVVMPPLSASDRMVESLAFSPDGKTIAAGNKDGNVTLWDVSTGQGMEFTAMIHKTVTKRVSLSFDLARLGNKPVGTNAVRCVAFSPDGRIVATGSMDGNILLWDVAARKPIGGPLIAHTNAVQRLSFSSDGRTLASCGDDSTVILWDTASRQPLGRPLAGHRGPVYSVAISPDMKRLASAGADKTVILWDLDTHQPIGLPFAGPDEAVWAVAFLPDGHALASGGFEPLPPRGHIILWDLRYESWKEGAGRLANRNLSAVEWDRYIGRDIPYHRTISELPDGHGVRVSSATK